MNGQHQELSQEPSQEPSSGLPKGYENALSNVPFSDWLRMWLGFRPRSLPRRLMRQIDFNILETSIRSMWLVSALSLLAFIVVAVLMVPLSTQRGQIWLTVGMFDWVLLAFSVAAIERMRRRGTLTRGRYVAYIIPFTITGGTLWGSLPTAVGTEPLHRFYLAVSVCAAGIMITYFATVGVWQLSVASCVSMTASTLYAYARAGVPGRGLIFSLALVFVIGIVVISFGVTVALVRARYETVIADDRKHTIQMLMDDYQRGGHDWFWETDDSLRLIHLPPKMLVAAHGDTRIVNGQPLKTLLAHDPGALDDIANGRPFQSDVVVNGPQGISEMRLFGRPDPGVGVTNYRGVGSDLGAERRTVEREKEAARLEAMVALTSGITHDFNNQLATILGSVELAEYTADDASSSRVHLGRALDACLRSRSMIADLSAALGIGTPPESAPFEIVDSVEAVINDVNLSYPEMTMIRTGVVGVWGFADAAHYERALRNLIENACEANERHPSSSGRVTVDVEVGSSIVGGPVVRVFVTDDGPGIQVGNKNQVFEPFYTTWSDAGRAGLGLAVAKGFARQANGRLSIENSERGAKFRLEVPRALMENEIDSSGDPGSIGELVSHESLVGEFLLIEDDRNVATTIKKFLEAFGARVEVVDSVAAGLERIRATGGDYRCVVSDLLLPDGEGYEVVAELRERHPNAPVVYVSGFSRRLPGAVAPHLRAPLVPKPFSSSELLDALRTVGVTQPAAPPTKTGDIDPV